MVLYVFCWILWFVVFTLRVSPVSEHKMVRKIIDFVFITLTLALFVLSLYLVWSVEV